MNIYASIFARMKLAMLLPTSVPLWAQICTAFHLFRIGTCTPFTPSLSLTAPLSSPNLSLSPAHHPLDPPQNISTLTTWPRTPFGVAIPHLTTLTIIATGPIQSADDKKWLLAAIAYQQSEYQEQGDRPQGFNIWNNDWRFYMELGGTPLTMAMAVRTLQVYEGLVQAYGMATMAFVVQVGEDVRGFYWVTVKDDGVGVDVV